MATSSYLQYLPPVLWVPENDPPQVLGRHLRIHEKILTGLAADGLLARAAAPFTSAQLDSILLANETDAALFAVGDWITVVGTAERRQIVQFSGRFLFLDAALNANYLLGGTVRIADLVAGQTTFRANNATRVDTDHPLSILQAGTSENLTVASADASFITLRFGLTNSYVMDPAAVPVKLIDRLHVIHNGQPQQDFRTQIDQLARIFNPWRTRTELLEWLASWVALELPADWSEFQKRRLISEMARIYLQRGLKRGVFTYLDIYATSPARPRITVDDGDAVLHVRFAPDGTAAPHGVAQSNSVSPRSVPNLTVTALLHPTGLAFDSNNQLFVCDAGDTFLSVPRPPALWRVGADGRVDYGTVAGITVPMPLPLHSGNPVRRPCALTVDAANRVALLDTGNITSATQQRGAIYRFAPPGYAITTVITGTTVPAFPAVHPVDMTLDAAGSFVVLDRGRHPLGNPPSGASNPQIVVVSEGPLAVATHALPGVAEPTAIIAMPGGDFIVADAGNQSTAAPADLWRVSPAGGWTVTSLLGAMAAGTNPLVFPTGMVWQSVNVLLVCDTGLRWGFVGDPGNRTMAETPALYAVDLSGPAPVIRRVTTQRHLVVPTKMAWSRAAQPQLLITDRGETQNNAPNRNWRAGSNEFGVSVFFSNQRPTTTTERNSFRRGLMNVVDGERVAHTSWWIDF
jgi:phage tail-like protein